MASSLSSGNPGNGGSPRKKRDQNHAAMIPRIEATFHRRFWRTFSRFIDTVVTDVWPAMSWSLSAVVYASTVTMRDIRECRTASLP